MEKAPTEKMGDLVVSHICLTRWTRLRVLRGWGKRDAEALVGQVLSEGLQSLAIYGKGASVPHLPGYIWLLKGFQG